jgi:hypothetical protein
MLQIGDQGVGKAEIARRLGVLDAVAGRRKMQPDVLAERNDAKPNSRGIP